MFTTVSSEVHPGCIGLNNISRVQVNFIVLFFPVVFVLKMSYTSLICKLVKSHLNTKH